MSQICDKLNLFRKGNGRVTTYNANRPHGFGVLDPETFAPYPKNPVIGAFFREIDRADELGSGMRNMMQYGRKYGGADPQLIEGDVFRMIISVPEFGEAVEGETEQVAAQVDEQVGDKDKFLADSELQNLAKKLEDFTAQVTAQVMLFCREPKGAREIMGILGLKHWKTFQANYLNPLLAADLIEMTIPDKPRSSKQKYRLTEKGRIFLERSSK